MADSVVAFRLAPDAINETDGDDEGAARYAEDAEQPGE